MNAHELAAWLLEGPDIPVVLSKDPEGNLYRPMLDVDTGYYYQGDIYAASEMTDEDFKAMQLSVVLTP